MKNLLEGVGFNDLGSRIEGCQGGGSLHAVDLIFVLIRHVAVAVAVIEDVWHLKMVQG